MTLILNGTDNSATVPAVQGGTAGTSTGLYYPSTNQVAISTAGTQAVFVNASQQVGIGTSSPSYKLDVVGTGDLANRVSTTGTSNAASIILQSGSGTTSGLFAYARFLNNDTNAQDWRIGTYGTNNLSIVNAKAGTVPVTVDTSGNLLVGTTAGLGSSGKAQIAQPSGTTGAAVLSLDALSTSYAYTIAYLNTNTVAGSGFSFIRCTTGGYAQSRFLVVGNGDVQNTNNSYGAISDVKLKENIVDATPKLVDLMQVKIRNYNLIGETTKQIGVVAQELEQVFPNMVVELADKDADNNDVGTTTKSVKYSVFVPILIKCIQEQQALITSLTARIEALEAV